MLSHKEINKLIEGVLGIEPRYELRRQLRVIFSGLTYEEALDSIKGEEFDDIRHEYTITSERADNYCEDLSLTLSAAKNIAEKNNQTFVLSLEDGEWKAAYGAVWDCAEYKGANPAYVSCMALLMYMGKI